VRLNDEMFRFDLDFLSISSINRAVNIQLNVRFQCTFRCTVYVYVYGVVLTHNKPREGLGRQLTKLVKLGRQLNSDRLEDDPGGQTKETLDGWIASGPRRD